ncbi:MAG TPA: hypothetical protein VF114_03925, partial [Candidatus Limnocylindria bacterium]
MRPRRTFVIPVAASVLMIIALVVTQLQIGAPAARRDTPTAQREEEGEEEEGEESGMKGEGEAFPPALSEHLEELAKTYPGNEGLEEEGPGSAAEAEFVARAYPAETISVGQMDRARTAFTQTKNTAFPRGKPKAGSWVSVGPSQALYPFEELRTSGLYIPNEYVAGGRTTDTALAPTCVPGNCVFYIAAAGGGVWRTKNALADVVSWTYLGGPLGINATGTVEI